MGQHLQVMNSISLPRAMGYIICEISTLPSRLAERAVQTFKAGLRKASGKDLPTKFARFLFQYRITPHTTTEVSPAELLMKRRLRSHLDLLHLSVEARVHANQKRQKTCHDQHSKKRLWKLEDLLFVKNF